MLFRIFLMIFGVVVVHVLFKYWDQSIIENSVLSSYQKFKSKYLSGVQQNTYRYLDPTTSKEVSLFTSKENCKAHTKIAFMKTHKTASRYVTSYGFFF